jgi:hypothetical protein
MVLNQLNNTRTSVQELSCSYSSTHFSLGLPQGYEP